MNDAKFGGVILALVVTVLILAFTSTYSAYVSSTNHRNSCTSRGLLLDTIHDVVVDAFTPFPGQTFSDKQARQVVTREAVLFARINQARC